MGGFAYAGVRVTLLRLSCVLDAIWHRSMSADSRLANATDTQYGRSTYNDTSTLIHLESLKPIKLITVSAFMSLQM